MKISGVSGCRHKRLNFLSKLFKPALPADTEDGLQTWHHGVSPTHAALLFVRLDLLDSDKTEARAASLLHGLGFTKEMQAKKTRDFSGGWRMRIALARALFTPTDLLLLGEALSPMQQPCSCHRMPFLLLGQGLRCHITVL